MLRHNPRNEVTVDVERVISDDGRTLVRKELRAPPAGSGRGPGPVLRIHGHGTTGVARSRPTARRSCAAAWVDAGLDLPECEVEHTADGAVLWLEDVQGVPGMDFALVDHVALAERLGRWQAAGPLELPWTSTGFLRGYSTTRRRRTNWWRTTPPGSTRSWQTCGRPRSGRAGAGCWPTGTLLDVMERLPRTRSHLDVWVSNEFRRTDGTVVLVDWAFAGTGSGGGHRQPRARRRFRPVLAGGTAARSWRSPATTPTSRASSSEVGRATRLSRGSASSPRRSSTPSCCR